jgi:hypothetical protein
VGDYQPPPLSSPTLQQVALLLLQPLEEINSLTTLPTVAKVEADTKSLQWILIIEDIKVDFLSHLTSLLLLSLMTVTVAMTAMVSFLPLVVMESQVPLVFLKMPSKCWECLMTVVSSLTRAWITCVRFSADISRTQ